MFKNILLCSDGSDQAINAARVAASIAHSCSSAFTVVNVFDLAASTVPYMGQWGLMTDAEGYALYATEVQNSAEQRTGNVLSEQGVEYTSIKEMGRPVDIIVSVAERIDSDLIVLGNRGLTSWEALLLGSVADGVVHYAHRPVLVVRGNNPQFNRVLLAADGSEAACRAARVATDIASAFDVPLTVLSVFEPSHNYPAVLQEAATDPEAYSVSVLNTMRDATLAAVKDCTAVAEVAQEEGHPAEVIIRYAEEHKADLSECTLQLFFPLHLSSYGMCSCQLLYIECCPWRHRPPQSPI